MKGASESDIDIQVDDDGDKSMDFTVNCSAMKLNMKPQIEANNNSEMTEQGLNKDDTAEKAHELGSV